MGPVVLLSMLMVAPPVAPAPAAPPEPAAASGPGGEALVLPARPPPSNGRFWVLGGATLGAPAGAFGLAYLAARGFLCGEAQAGPDNAGEDQPSCAEARRGLDLQIGLNLGATALATASVVAGALLETRFDRWRVEHGHTPPPDGGGMLGAGVGLLSFAALHSVSQGLLLLDEPLDPSDGAFYVVPLASFAVAGAVFTGLGARRRVAYNRNYRNRYGLRVESRGGGRFAFGPARRR